MILIILPIESRSVYKNMVVSITSNGVENVLYFTFFYRGVQWGTYGGVAPDINVAYIRD